MPLPQPTPKSAALITGASSGIGAEIARLLARRGHGVILVARREDRLQGLATELADTHAVRAEVIACDLTDPEARDDLAAQVAEGGRRVAILVNNAGFGSHGNFVGADTASEVKMVRLNVEAVTDLLGRFLPPMVDEGEGAVINIASTAAFQPMPGSATYGGTKAFVLNQGEALNHELRDSGVTVTTVCPGPVKTEFAEVAGVEEMESDAPEAVLMEPEEIAEAALEAVEQGKRAVIPGKINRVGAIAGRLTPNFLVLPALERLWNR
ncbi:MAG: SDR family NAD(P)-dependent oxidoreductase [Solirubrobacterales bacterium]